MNCTSVPNAHLLGVGKLPIVKATGRIARSLCLWRPRYTQFGQRAYGGRHRIHRKFRSASPQSTDRVDLSGVMYNRPQQ
uniref:Uncharacterized protein n=1 Tax=Hyaloperonospora arabidopsidis (strain Emoy2) TaxID=559515 RepID=M4B5B3_HYAAE